MDLNKKRREHNTKRVGEAIRGNKWDLNKPSVHVIPRTADKVEPKKPESGHPGRQFTDHDWHRKPNHNDYDKKPKGPDNPPYGGSPVTPKPKPKSPTGGQTIEAPYDKKRKKEYDGSKPDGYVSPYTVTRKK
jgi:hypothetical protein